MIEIANPSEPITIEATLVAPAPVAAVTGTGMGEVGWVVVTALTPPGIDTIVVSVSVSERPLFSLRALTELTRDLPSEASLSTLTSTKKVNVSPPLIAISDQVIVRPSMNPPLDTRVIATKLGMVSVTTRSSTVPSPSFLTVIS